MIKSFLKFLKSKDFKEFIILFILGLIINLLCLVIYKIPVKAATAENNRYFPMHQNDNDLFPQYILDYFNDTYSDDYYFILRWWGHNASFNEDYIYYLLIPKSNDYMVYGEILNNGYQFSLYNVGNQSTNISNGYIGFRNGSVSDFWNGGQNISGWQSLNSSIYDVNTSFVSNFRIDTNNTDNSSVVLKYGWQLPSDFFHNDSHATPPDTFESPVYTTGHTPPTNVPPKYTINNYTWTTYTPPTIDTSNAETLLESIYNAIVYNGQYLKDNIHGELTNLVDNIGGFFEYIGDTIQYYGNLIISNIQNGITTFYNNINSAIVGIGNAVGYITQPLDMDNLTNAVNSTHIWGDIGTCTSYANDAFGIYGTVAEPNTFKIPLDLRSISLLNITQVYYIDLSWLDGAKQAIRAFMWCVVTFGLLYSVIVDIPNMIRSSK